jgi:hypothetical protein
MYKSNVCVLDAMQASVCRQACIPTRFLRPRESTAPPSALARRDWGVLSQLPLHLYILPVIGYLNCRRLAICRELAAKMHGHVWLEPV